MEKLLQLNTQRLAKRQRTWFRRYIADEKENPKKNVEYKVWYLD
jgi:tRNA A37 N6-isopentenylltransferase MiaA